MARKKFDDCTDGLGDATQRAKLCPTCSIALPRNGVCAACAPVALTFPPSVVARIDKLRGRFTREAFVEGLVGDAEVRGRRKR